MSVRKEDMSVRNSVCILAVHSSRVKDAYKEIGDIEISEDEYSVEIPYDNGIFRLWLGESDLGSITYRKWGEGIRPIVGFMIEEYQEDDKENFGCANAISMYYYENIDTKLINFLESVAEKVKERLE